MKGILRGPKFNMRHTSYIPAAERLIVAAKALSEVTKISLGVILRGGSDTLRISGRVIPAGLRIIVRGGRQVQKLFIYTSTPEATAAALDVELDTAPSALEG